MPSPDLTLSDMPRANATRFPDVPAYVEGGAAVTHAELLARAGRLVGALARRGVRRQDRIAVLGRNSARFVDVLSAGWPGSPATAVTCHG